MLAATLVFGCSTTSRSGIEAGYDNLSGTYRYTGLGQYSADQFPNPLIEFSNIKIPSDVHIEQYDGVFQVAYLSSLGEAVTTIFNPNNSENGNVVWSNKMLNTTERVPITGPAILPLPAKHYRGTRILKGADRNLYVIGFFKEKGLFFTDYWEHELLLRHAE